MRATTLLVLALVACSPAPKAKPAPPEPAAPVVDAAAVSERPRPAIAWAAGAALIVDERWSVDTATWHWTALVGNRDARTPTVTFPEEPGARADGGVRDASGERVAWPEPGRVCLQVKGVAGYSCATVPPRPTE